MTDSMKCQCPETGAVPPGMEYMYQPEEQAGMNHEPGQCQGTYNLARYRRGDEILVLCSCCCLIGDVRLDE